MNVQEHTAATSPGVEAVDQQLAVASFVQQLAADQAVCRRFVDGSYSPVAGVNPIPTFDEMLALARHTSGFFGNDVLPFATPYAWHGDAARYVSDLSQRLRPDDSLSAAALPALTGWAWWGHEPRAFSPNHVCAFAWDTTEVGVIVLPFRLTVGHGGTEVDLAGRPYRVAPMILTALPIDYDMPLAEIESRWPRGMSEPIRDVSINQARVFIASCMALARGDLHAQPAAVGRDDCLRLRAKYPHQRFSPQVRLVTATAGRAAPLH